VAWTELSGPASVTFTNPAYPQSYAYFTAAGTYVLQLSANDTQLTSTSTVTITVLPPPNQPPIVNAGPGQSLTLPNATVTFNGTVSDDGLPSGILNVQWVQTSGPVAATIATPNQAVTQSPAPPQALITSRWSPAMDNLQALPTRLCLFHRQISPPWLMQAPTRRFSCRRTRPRSPAVRHTMGNQTLTYQWSEVSGQAKVVIARPISPPRKSPSPRWDSCGSYAFQLMVK